MKPFLISLLIVKNENGGTTYGPRAWLMVAENANEARGKAAEKFMTNGFALNTIDVVEVTEVERWVRDDGRGERQNLTDLRAKANEVTRAVVSATPDATSDSIYEALKWAAGWR